MKPRMTIRAGKLARLALAGPLVLLACAQANDAARQQIAEASDQAVAELAALKSTGKLNTRTALGVIQDKLSPDIHFSALAQNAMGKHWRKASDAHKQALTAQFRVLLENTYAVTMSKFTGQRVAVVASRDLDDGTASVMLEVSDGRKKARIENIMANIGGSWGVVDIKVEGVSLISNYRRQFDGVVRKFGIPGLVAALKKKNGT